jgi:flagellar biosynthesis regulator FlaF
MTVALRRYKQAVAETDPVAAEAKLFERMADHARCKPRRFGRQLSRRVRAIAEARRLWLHTATLCADPDNHLPQALRAQIISVALAVLREIDGESPDVAWLAEITRTIAEGLRDASRHAARRLHVVQALSLQHGV